MQIHTSGIQEVSILSVKPLIKKVKILNRFKSLK